MHRIPKVEASDNRSLRTKNLILDLVRSGQLKKGEKLPPQNEMAERLGVSRTSLREALMELSYRGIIACRHGKGTFVCDDIVEAEATMEARRILEPKMVVLAAERGNEEELERLVSLHRDMDRYTREDRPAEFYVADLAFHAAIADMTRNPALVLLFSTIRDILFYRQNMDKLPPPTMKKANAFHADIIAAIRGRDAAAAESVMVEHINDVVDSLK